MITLKSGAFPLRYSRMDSGHVLPPSLRPKDSEPLPPAFDMYERLLVELADAYARANDAERWAQMFAFAWVFSVVSAAIIICIMAAT